jgi:hypothetical protein
MKSEKSPDLAETRQSIAEIAFARQFQKIKLNGETHNM